MEAIRQMLDYIGRMLWVVVVQAVATEVTYRWLIYLPLPIFVHPGLAMMEFDHG
jgi:hypothetical protein